jgi:hypothetical protein
VERIRRETDKVAVALSLVGLGEEREKPLAENDEIAMPNVIYHSFVVAAHIV